MAKTKAAATLFDLFSRGRIETITDDDSGLEVTVWLQRLTPADIEKCFRRANAAKATRLAQLRDHESDDYLEVVASVERFDREQLVDTVIAQELRNESLSIEAELELGEDDDGEPSEWGKDGYLQGLREAWDETLNARHLEDPDDPEANRVLAELRRFADQVDEAVNTRRKALRADWDHTPIEDLRAKVIDLFVDADGDVDWNRAFDKARLYHAVRDPDNHRNYYFADFGVDAIDQLQPEVTNRLLGVLDAITVDAQAGKGLPRTIASLLSSAPPEPSEPTSSSGELAAATA